MATDKALLRLEAKVDALLEKAGLKPADFAGTSPLGYGGRVPPKLTPEEQQAINNAPKAKATIPPTEKGPRVTAQNAPSVASSVPASAAKGKK